MNDDDIERIDDALYEAGISIRQLGTDGVVLGQRDDGSFMLQCDGEKIDIEYAEDAIEFAQRWADDAGVEFRDGHIDVFIERLEELCRAHDIGPRQAAMLFDDGEPLASAHDELCRECGMWPIFKYHRNDNVTVYLDSDGAIAFYVDPNQILWLVEFEDEDPAELVYSFELIIE